MAGRACRLALRAWALSSAVDDVGSLLRSTKLAQTWWAQERPRRRRARVEAYCFAARRLRRDTAALFFGPP